MPYVSDDDITKIRESTDLVQLISERVPLRQRGRVWWGCCPFHSEKTPSFKVDPASGFWHCFGCGEGGDAFGYVMRTEGMDFSEAVHYLADRAHITLSIDPQAQRRKGEQDELRAVCADTANFYSEQLLRVKTPATEAARAYLSGRGFGTNVAHTWRLGYAPGRGQLFGHLKAKGHQPETMVKANVVTSYNGRYRDRFFERLMFPITDLQGRIIAFGGRVVPGLSTAPGEGMPTAKYLNSNDTPIFHKSDNLYGIAQARKSILERSCVLVVEGYTDVIALHEAGFTNAVATLGTALNAYQVRLLSRFAQRIVYLFDGDAAGQRAADRAVEFIDAAVRPEFASNPLKLDVVVIPDDADPAELMAREGGKEQLQQLIDTAVPLFEFAIDRRLERWNLERPEERRRALSDAVEVLTSLQGSLLATEYAQKIADKLAAQGSAVELRQVLAELETATARRKTRDDATARSEARYRDGTHFALGREAEESSTSFAPQVDFAEKNSTSSLQPNAEESISQRFSHPQAPGANPEQDLLALVILSPEVRETFISQLSSDLFGDLVYRKLVEEVRAQANASSQENFFEKISKKFPTLQLLIPLYDTMIKPKSEPKALAQSILQHLHEAKLQSEIIQLKARLRAGTDEATAATDLMKRERKLQELRAKRYKL